MFCSSASHTQHPSLRQPTVPTCPSVLRHVVGSVVTRLRQRHTQRHHKASGGSSTVTGRGSTLKVGGQNSLPIPFLLLPFLSFPSVPSFPFLFPRPFSFPLFLEVGPLNTSRSLGSAVSYPSGVWGEAQPTNDLVHIRGQNNSSWCDIF